MPLPAATILLMDCMGWLVRYGFWLFCTVQVFVLSFIVSSTFRWYLPVVGRFSRMQAQSRVLKMLGLLLQAGYSVPRALRVLLESGYFGGLPQRRLEKVYSGVCKGGDLPSELYRRGLLPKSMMTLVQSAVKLNNLPWRSMNSANTSQRTANAAHRFCMALFPICLMLIGSVVAFYAYAMFTPLLALLEMLEKY